MSLNKNYSFLSKTLHHLVLGSNVISEMLYDIEMAIFKKKLDKNNSRSHIFVCGLPRSGTTILMNALYKTDQFASLTYRDMPFVISPNLWSKISDRNIKSMPAKERLHGDNKKLLKYRLIKKFTPFEEGIKNTLMWYKKYNNF